MGLVTVSRPRRYPLIFDSRCLNQCVFDFSVVFSLLLGNHGACIQQASVCSALKGPPRRKQQRLCEKLEKLERHALYQTRVPPPSALHVSDNSSSVDFHICASAHSSNGVGAGGTEVLHAVFCLHLFFCLPVFGGRRSILV